MSTRPPEPPESDEPLRHEVDYADGTAAVPSGTPDAAEPTEQPTAQLPADAQPTAELPPEPAGVAPTAEMPAEPAEPARTIAEPAEPVEPADPARTIAEPAEPEPVAHAADAADEPADDAAEPPPAAAPPPPGPPPFGPPPGPPPPGPPPFGPPPGPPPFGPPPQGAWAARYGLVRPLSGRYLAGVCAAIGRATNTDPVLWRVVLAVLTLFGGVGLLVYLVGWLVIPAEGDTASPVEALFGRGRSRTSPLVVIAVGALALLMFGVAFSGNLRGVVLGAAVIGGAAWLLSRNGAANRPPGAYVPPPPVPPAAPGPVPPPPPMPGYRPPFAPGGPYASSSPYAASLGYAYPGLGPQPVQPSGPPAPKRPRSRLGRVVVSLVALAIGILAVVDASGASLPGSAYVALPLALVALGLIAGAWLGRARWLIVPGLLLTVALAASSTAERVDWQAVRHHGGTGDVTWAPTTIADIQTGYRLNAGNATLDLSRLDFTDHTVDVDVDVNVGDLTIILPPNVDTNVDAKVSVGDGKVFDQSWNGIDKSRRHITDNGADGPGGGHLNLKTDVSLGNLEVHR